jgi:multisubunit Na+/H+ antiporter MnhG subunit
VSPLDLVAAFLMALGTTVLVVAALGAALPRDPFVRLHYLSLGAMAGAPLVLVGVLVHDPADWFKLVVITLLLVAASPVGSAASARAIAREGSTSGPRQRGSDA